MVRPLFGPAALAPQPLLPPGRVLPAVRRLFGDAHPGDAPPRPAPAPAPVISLAAEPAGAAEPQPVPRAEEVAEGAGPGAGLVVTVETARADELWREAPLLGPSPEELELRRQLEQAQRDLEAMKQRYQQALVQLQQVQHRDYAHLEGELVELAVEVAREILQGELQGDRQHLTRLAAAALRVATSDEVATVMVCPEDAPHLMEEREGLERERGGALVKVVADPALRPGDCVVQVGRSRIDARLEERLERVRKALHDVTREQG